jgi:ATP-dependent Clp protease ATP-binding subunit ClpB
VLTGYSTTYGARPLRRLVQTAIGDQLAKEILAGEVPDGATVTVDVDHEQTDPTAERLIVGVKA